MGLRLGADGNVPFGRIQTKERENRRVMVSCIEPLTYPENIAKYNATARRLSVYAAGNVDGIPLFDRGT